MPVEIGYWIKAGNSPFSPFGPISPYDNTINHYKYE